MYIYIYVYTLTEVDRICDFQTYSHFTEVFVKKNPYSIYFRMTIWSYVYDVFLYINRVIQPKSRTRGPKSTDFSQLILIKSPTCASATTTFTRKPKQFGTVIRRPFLYVVKIPDSLLFGSSRNLLYQFAHSALLQRCLPSWNPWKRRAFATPPRHTVLELKRIIFKRSVTSYLPWHGAQSMMFIKT